MQDDFVCATRDRLPGVPANSLLWAGLRKETTRVEKPERKVDVVAPETRKRNACAKQEMPGANLQESCLQEALAFALTICSHFRSCEARSFVFETRFFPSSLTGRLVAGSASQWLALLVRMHLLLGRGPFALSSRKKAMRERLPARMSSLAFLRGSSSPNEEKSLFMKAPVCSALNADSARCIDSIIIHGRTNRS